MKRAWAIVGLAVIAVIGVYGAARAYRHFKNNRVVNVPVERNVAVTNTVVSNRNTNQAVNRSVNTNSSNQPIPAELNLSAPFTSQAPFSIWDADHEDFCEEASVLMAARALQGRAINDAADAEQALQQLKAWELENLGFFESTSASETSSLVRGVYGLQTRLLTRPTVTDLKQALANGQLIIVPSAGRELHNPNFKQPGPIYHMLLLKGFTKDEKWVTNDPGTRKGQNYVYDQLVLMNAIHDWNGGDVANGVPVVIVISP